MNVMLVAASDEVKPFVERIFTFHHVDVIYYNNPIKAMDNLDEIQPDVIIFMSGDFPRHWKPFITYLRNTFNRRETIFILLVNETFDTDEANKAEHLQVNAILDDDLTNNETVERIRGIVTRYHQSVDIRKTTRHLPATTDQIRCIFTSPYTFTICTGTVLDISAGGIRIKPEDPALNETLDTHAIITMASLRLGETILAVQLKVIRIAEAIAFEFVNLTVEIERTIADYIAARMNETLVTEAVSEGAGDP